MLKSKETAFPPERGDAVAVARKLKFIPAMKDARPVLQFNIIEYNFNLY
jgi:hypothetical protein